ncbi:MAG: bifunctional phosphoribosylaminoimidazolecarboxamide formyltransferase/IMP cyclohydrolase [Pseudomonadota bacterium]
MSDPRSWDHKAPADHLPIRRALISVSDKAGIVEFARALAAAGVALISTGGTATLMREAGLTVTDVAEVTGFPEMMSGRVKTLHPKIHGALLADRGNTAHMAEAEAHDIAPIDLVVVNLYPFEAAIARGAAPGELVETIDIGGPAMLRSAAKNHAHVAVVTDTEDFAPVAEEIARTGGLSQATRTALAATAYARTAAYDAAVAGWLARHAGQTMPRRRVIAGKLAAPLRYGENPHQAAGFYRDDDPRPGVGTATQLQGKALSYNNINDTDAAFELVADLGRDRPACVIVKHANPCGVALGDTLAEAYQKAYDCDRTPAFGGIVAFNRRIDAAAADAVCRIFTEVVIAPEADAGARRVFAAKRDLRVLIAGAMPVPATAADRRLHLRQVSGGFLAQDMDDAGPGLSAAKCVTVRQPTEMELSDMAFAWTIARHVKSNAIVYARDRATVGIGAGQMSRVDSTRIAARKAGDMAEALGLAMNATMGSVVASDAFFPFADGLITAADAGATAVVQPGGSIRDGEVIEAANTRGLAMLFVGRRHFRH